MKRILAYIVKLLVTTTAPNYFESIWATAKFSLILTPFLFVWDKITNWGISNSDYILVVMGAILVDYIFGTVKHLWFTKDFTFKGNANGLVMKLGLAVAGGFLFEGLSYLTKESEMLFEALKITTRVIIFMYPAMSAWENLYIVSGEKFPPKTWMDRLNIFGKTLNPSDLIKKEKENEGNN